MILVRMLLVSALVFFHAAGTEAGEPSRKKQVDSGEKQTKRETVEKDKKPGDKVRDREVAAELDMLKMMEMLEHIDLLEDMDVLGKGGSR